VLRFKRERAALAQQIGPSFCIRKILPAALPLISIQVILIMLTLDVAVLVIPKLVEEFVAQRPLCPAKICRQFRMTSNR